MQILADVLNISIEPSDAAAGAGYGIALTAAEAAGNVRLIKHSGQEDPADTRKKKVFSPRAYNVTLYQKKYLKYLKIHRALGAVFH